VGSDTGSSPRTELAAALHRLRSTLSRLKAELELAAEDDAKAPALGMMQADVDEALEFLSAAEDAVHPTAGRVLVLDDDERLAEITARGLRRLGYQAEAGDRLRELHGGEVLVFDLSLAPNLDQAAADSVRAARPVVVTGATDPASRSLALSLDASDYLLKPVEPEALARAVSRRMTEG
jgi:CheY-like chemotaxis protein